MSEFAVVGYRRLNGVVPPRGAYFPTRKSLFEYRIRQSLGKWFVITHDDQIECTSFLHACLIGEQFKSRGYVDGDR
jgi:hypothetical protein